MQSSFTGISTLTQEEYEDAYREALLCLREVIEVGTPQAKDGQLRTCKVGDEWLTDAQVLERWWGPKIAARIRVEIVKE